MHRWSKNRQCGGQTMLEATVVLMGLGVIHQMLSSVLSDLEGWSSIFTRQDLVWRLEKQHKVINLEWSLSLRNRLYFVKAKWPKWPRLPRLPESQLQDELLVRSQLMCGIKMYVIYQPWVLDWTRGLLRCRGLRRKMVDVLCNWIWQTPKEELVNVDQVLWTCGDGKLTSRREDHISLSREHRWSSQSRKSGSDQEVI